MSAGEFHPRPSVHWARSRGRGRGGSLRSVRRRTLPAPLLGCTAWDTFGKSDSIGHDVTVNRRPYIPDLSDSQPQSALATEDGDRRDRTSAPSDFRARLAALALALAAHRGCRNGIPRRLSRKSLSGPPLPIFSPGHRCCVPRHRPATWIATEGSRRRRRRRRECRRYRGYDLRCKGSLAFS